MSRDDPLADIQVRVVGEAGERYLVIARYVESKLARAEVRAGLRPAIQDLPCLALLDLMHDLRRANPDVKRAVGLLVELMGNYDLVCLLPVANDGAVEVILVDLEQDVVFGIGVVEHPLQKAALDGHRGKGKGAGSRSDSVQDEVSSFTNERISLMLPCARGLPL